ncbi:MAG: hypothetical protein KBT02_06035 [Treponema sp.]|nr:hypothetical protein [Candidatus Treponema caballi]
MVANNSVTLFIDIAQIILAIAAAGFFFWGLMTMIKGLKLKEDAVLAANMKKRSIIILAGGCMFYFLYSFFADLESMLLADYNLLAVALRAFWRTVLNTGFIPLLPVVLQRTTRK